MTTPQDAIRGALERIITRAANGVGPFECDVTLIRSYIEHTAAPAAPVWWHFVDANGLLRADHPCASELLEGARERGETVEGLYRHPPDAMADRLAEALRKLSEVYPFRTFKDPVLSRAWREAEEALALHAAAKGGEEKDG